VAGQTNGHDADKIPPPCHLVSSSEPAVLFGCSSGGSGNRHGEDHDEISTDRFGGGLIARRSHACHGSKWPADRRISTGHEKPESLRLLQLRWTLCAVLLWNALLCSGVPRPTLRLHGLARLGLARLAVSRQKTGPKFGLAPLGPVFLVKQIVSRIRKVDAAGA
jgi:hypothetical protein